VVKLTPEPEIDSMNLELRDAVKRAVKLTTELYYATMPPVSGIYIRIQEELRGIEELLEKYVAMPEDGASGEKKSRVEGLVDS